MNLQGGSIVDLDGVGNDASNSVENPVIDLDNELINDISEHEINKEENNVCKEENDEIPIYMKPSVLDKHLFVGEIDDKLLDFTGDSGAIGRFNCADSPHESNITIDFIGRQYTGQLRPGPSVILLSLGHQPAGNAAPALSAQDSDNKEKPKMQQVAKVESVANEMCKLQFHKDILGNIFGIYTQENDGNDSDDDQMKSGSVDDGDDLRAKKKPKMNDKSSLLKPKIASNRKFKVAPKSKKKSTPKKK